MKVLLSPAKTLNFENNQTIGEGVAPLFIEEAQKVNNKLAKLSGAKLMELQKISKDLAKLNRRRNLERDMSSLANTRQAALAFKGDVYLGMEAEHWSEVDMQFAIQHLWILSGLYGLLSPNTLISPYRLEMGTALGIGRKRNLYAFWKDSFKAYFDANLDPELPIVNLASKEYAEAVLQLNLANPVIDIEFLDASKGDYKILSFFAKKARGMMANYIVQNRLNDWKELKDFNLAGYYYDPSRSKERKLVFLRDKK